MLMRCPHCHSSDVHPIKTVNEEGYLIDPVSESKRTIQHIMAYAAMGASVGRKIRVIHPVVGTVAGAAVGTVVGAAVYGSPGKAFRKFFHEQLFPRYHCHDCGHTFQRPMFKTQQYS